MANEIKGMEQLTVYLDPNSPLERMEDYGGNDEGGKPIPMAMRLQAFHRAILRNGNITCGEWLKREKARIEKTPGRKAEIHEIPSDKSSTGKVQALYVNLDGVVLFDEAVKKKSVAA